MDSARDRHHLLKSNVKCRVARQAGLRELYGRGRELGQHGRPDSFSLNAYVT